MNAKALVKLAMQNLEIRYPAMNGIIFVADPTHRFQIPLDRIGFAPIVATASCIAIATLHEQFGEITIRLGRDFAKPEGQMAFEGTLETPGHALEVSGVMEDLLSMRVPNRLTKIKIWVNCEKEPDLVTIEAQ